MLGRSRREHLNVKVIRNGKSEPFDDNWSEASPAERIEGVWMLTKLCLAWNQESDDEPRLQRTITHVQRARR